MTSPFNNSDDFDPQYVAIGKERADLTLLAIEDPRLNLYTRLGCVPLQDYVAYICACHLNVCMRAGYARTRRHSLFLPLGTRVDSEY